MLPDDKATFRIYKVVGVVEDYHTGNLHKKISPVILFPSPYKNYTNINFMATNTQEMITAIEKIWNELAPGQPFSYTFLDDRFAGFYQADQRVDKIMSVFTGITIFIACMGLFGLVTFIAEQKVKEIGIRKVLGANVFSITSLLSKDFIKLVLISILPAIPLAYYIMNNWLRDFEYRTSIELWIFFAVTIILLAIALITISVQAVKAAIANPIKSLRSE
jgi:putative ABC transport system permease protein